MARLVAGALVRLPGMTGPVRLISVEPGAFWSFVYEHADGLDRVTLSEEELGEVELFDMAETPAFDGDAEEFRLGIEARRIKTTFTYEMAAVAVSNIRPLPHQLEAVYDEFLTQPRLRFLLADDPGAGKTIMAGLYAKELVLRRSGDRILLVVPANLRPQWVRELDERFQLSFVDMAAVFEASPNENPWDQHSHVIVSRDFLRQEHVLEAFQEAELEWDLAILDEAHGYSAYVDGKGRINKKSQRYVAAEAVSEQAHRLILMTATPHRGSDKGFWALLRLLDPPVFGDRCPKVVRVPKQLFRRVSKEAMRDMKGEPLFKPRHAHTLDFQLSSGERELYDAVTDFVSRKLAEIRIHSASRSGAGFALTTMQRRLASSTRAIRRTLERRLDRIERALEDPEGYIRDKGTFQNEVLGEDELEDLDEADRWEREEKALSEWLPTTVAELEAEREALEPLLPLAQQLEESKTERKLVELLDVVKTQGLREDRRKQLVIFTEHKDTLDLAGDPSGGSIGVGTGASARWGRHGAGRSRAVPLAHLADAPRRLPVHLGNLLRRTAPCSTGVRASADRLARPRGDGTALAAGRARRQPWRLDRGGRSDRRRTRVAHRRHVHRPRGPRAADQLERRARRDSL
jgi:SNF2 family DNA or RNA helicase